MENRGLCLGAMQTAAERIVHWAEVLDIVAFRMEHSVVQLLLPGLLVHVPPNVHGVGASLIALEPSC